MATYFWSQLANNQQVAFNPLVDVLLIDDLAISAAELSHAWSNDNSITFTYTDITSGVPDKKFVTLAATGIVRQLTATNLVFADGSLWLWGDGSTANGDDGSNTLTGGAGDDRLVGLGGNDLMNGGDGNDRFESGYASASTGIDIVNGGAGSDTFSFNANSTAGATVNLATHSASNAQGSATLSSIERVQGTAGDDLLIGGDVEHRRDILGNTVSEVLRGRRGNDTIIGGGGLDFFAIADYNDFSDAITGISVNLSQIDASGYVLVSNDGFGNQDRLLNIDMVIGTYRDDVITGGSLNRDGAGLFYEIFRGLAGNDVLNGNNALTGGGRASSDRADYATNLASQAIIVNLGDIAITLINGQTVSAGTAMDGMGGIDTLIDIDQVYGGAGNDYLAGGLLNDIFDGGAGNDTLDGGSGTDSARFQQSVAGVIVNLSGRSFVLDPLVRSVTGLNAPITVAAGTAYDGMGGTDTLISIEQIRGSDFNDYIRGGDSVTQREFYSGDGGDDFIDGGAGIDIAVYQDVPLSNGGITASLQRGADGLIRVQDGKGGVDTLIGIEGLSGTRANDTLTGGTGNDWLRGDGGNDFLDGGAGVDWVFYSNSPSGVVVNLAAGIATDGWDGVSGLLALGGVDQLRNFENAEGSDYDDVLVGDAADNAFRGRYGNDVIDGGTGSDIAYYSGNLSDYSVTFNANGSLTVSDQRTVPAVYLGYGGIVPYDGTDTLRNIEYLRFSNGIFDVRSAATRPAGWSVILGTSGSDFLNGTAGNDLIDGLQGGDNMAGGAGDDIYMVDTLSDNVTELAGAGLDTVATLGNVFDYTLTANVENLVAFGETYRVNGNELDNVIRIAAASDFIFGSGGTSQVIVKPGAGHDTISSDPIPVTSGWSGSGQNFVVQVDYSANTASQSIQANLGTGTLIDGLGGTDTLIGVRGVNGGAGNDTLVGGGLSRGQARTFFEVFTGNAGNDFIDGGELLRGYDNRAEYTTSPLGIVANLGAVAIQVNGQTIAAGTALDGWGGIDTLVNIMSVRGSAQDDYFQGADNRGMPFSETFIPDGGADIVNGGAGIDTVRYDNATGNVIVNLGPVAVTRNGITVEAGTAYDGWGYVDTLVDIESVVAGQGNDLVVGNDGNNTLDGDRGNDILSGGEGIDYASYSRSAQAISVYLSGGEASVGDGWGGTDTLTGIEGIIGTAYDDWLVGGAGDQWFIGRGGSNFIAGGEGADWVSYRQSPESGGVWVDLQAGKAANTGWGGLFALGGVDTLHGIENIEAGDFNDSLTGDGGGNTFIGRAGNDTINGGLGVDTASYRGLKSDYTIGRLLDGRVTVTDKRTGIGNQADGSDTLSGIEVLQFSDGVLNLAALPDALELRPVSLQGGVATFELWLKPGTSVESGDLVLMHSTAQGSFKAGSIVPATGVTTAENPLPGSTSVSFFSTAPVGGVAATKLMSFSFDALPGLRQFDAGLSAASLTFAGQVVGVDVALPPPAAVNAVFDLSGIAYHWKNHVLLDGVTVSAQGGEASTQGAQAPIQLKNLKWDATGAATVEVWAQAATASQNVGFELDLGVGAEAQFTQDAALTGWTVVGNAQPTGYALAAFTADANTALAAGSYKLGTLSFSTGVAPQAQIGLVTGEVGTVTSTPYAINLARTVTDVAGSYTLTELDPGAYALQASRATTDSGNAITSADALAALRIAVGLNPNATVNGVQPLLSPYQIMAADVVGTDGRITSADALGILRMAVKLPTAPVNEWLFVEETRDFWNEAANNGQGAFTLTRTAALWDKAITATLQDNGEVNLVGVLKGDVNGTWAAPAGSQDLDVIDPLYFQSLATLTGAPLDQWAAVTVPVL